MWTELWRAVSSAEGKSEVYTVTPLFQIHCKAAVQFLCIAIAGLLVLKTCLA